MTGSPSERLAPELSKALDEVRALVPAADRAEALSYALFPMVFESYTQARSRGLTWDTLTAAGLGIVGALRSAPASPPPRPATNAAPDRTAWALAGRSRGSTVKGGWSVKVTLEIDGESKEVDVDPCRGSVTVGGRSFPFQVVARALLEVELEIGGERVKVAEWPSDQPSPSSPVSVDGERFGVAARVEVPRTGAAACPSKPQPPPPPCRRVGSLRPTRSFLRCPGRSSRSGCGRGSGSRQGPSSSSSRR